MKKATLLIIMVLMSIMASCKTIHYKLDVALDVSKPLSEIETDILHSFAKADSIWCKLQYSKPYYDIKTTIVTIRFFVGSHIIYKDKIEYIPLFWEDRVQEVSHRVWEYKYNLANSKKRRTTDDMYIY